MNNSRIDPINSNPESTFSQEGIEQTIKSLGDIMGIYNRKETLSRDPLLDSLVERLNRLVARKSDLETQIATVQRDFESEQEKTPVEPSVVTANDSGSLNVFG